VPHADFHSSLPLQLSATIIRLLSHLSAWSLLDYDGGLDWAELGVLSSRGLLLMRLAASGSCKAIISDDGADAAGYMTCV